MFDFSGKTDCQLPVSPLAILSMRPVSRELGKFFKIFFFRVEPRKFNEIHLRASLDNGVPAEYNVA